MAEIVITEIAKFFGEKLMSKALKEISSALDINSHINSLQEIKLTIEALFLDADKQKQSLSHAQKLCLERTSHALSKLDDFVDRKASMAKIRQMKGVRRRIQTEVISFLSGSVFREAREVTAIRKELDCITRDHSQFGDILRLLNVSVISQTSSRLETGSHVIKEEVIGRDKDRDNIIRLLLGSSSDGVQEALFVVTIFGIGGIGKSTLARYVYNDPMVNTYFELRLWVWASQDFEVREMLEKILECATNEKVDRYEMNQLERRVIGQIYGRRYLLVLDNVCEIQSLSLKWGQLWNVLRLGSQGSRILITTRSMSVARTLGTAWNPYLLKDLSDGDAWSMFEHVAFRSGQEPGVKEIGKQIFEKCHKVPLVIRVIAGLLRNKRTIEEWRSFRDNEFAMANVYGSDVLPILKLSYDELDPNLKLCFAYLSLFPKGYQFREHELIHCWIALGNVKGNFKKQSLLDAGEDCARSFLERGLLVDFGERMHDLVHDLAVSVAGSRFKMVGSKDDEIDERVRYVSFHKEANICLDSLAKSRYLQSFRAEMINSPCPKLTRLVKLFPYLRILCLRGLGIQEVPRNIGELIQLRHLNLSRNDFSELPKSIKGLVNLLSLNLSWCDKLKQLPKEIGEFSSLLSLNLTYCQSLENLPGEMIKLVKLRHLGLWGCWSLSQMPTGFGNLIDLKVLGRFVVGEDSGSDANGGGLCELKTLNNLEGGLEIIFKGIKCESSAANLHKKEKLLLLCLCMGSIKEKCEEVLEGLQPHTNLKKLEISGYHGRSFPSWMMKNKIHYCLPNLVELWIKDTDKCTHLCSLGRFPNLKMIYFEGLSSVEYIEEEEEGGPVDGDVNLEVAPLFPNLVELSLRNMPKLKGWRRTSTSTNTNHSTRPASFPRLEILKVENMRLEVVLDEFRGLSSLQTLKIKGCEELKEILGWIDEFTSLKILNIYDCPELKPLPEQIGNLPNLVWIGIAKCQNAYAEWWEDQTHPDCPIKLLDSETQWDWQFKSRDNFLCYKIRYQRKGKKSEKEQIMRKIEDQAEKGNNPHWKERDR